MQYLHQTFISSEISLKKSCPNTYDNRISKSVSIDLRLKMSYTLFRPQHNFPASHVIVCVFGCLSNSAFTIFPT